MPATPLVIRSGSRQNRMQMVASGKHVKLTIIEPPNQQTVLHIPLEYEDAIIERFRSAFADARAFADYERSKSSS